MLLETQIFKDFDSYNPLPNQMKHAAVMQLRGTRYNVCCPLHLGSLTAGGQQASVLQKVRPQPSKDEDI